MYYICRIKTISFDIAFRGFYEKGTLEKHNSVEVYFNFEIIMHNRVEANHIKIEIDLDPVLKRVHDSCKPSFRSSTAIDICVIIVTILSLVTHTYSMFNSAVLAKV